jgi:5'-AMP-activated protein kinase, regulatory gamma subunit
MSTATLTPTSPKVKRKPSTRRQRAGSHLAQQQTQETHDAALFSIRAFLRSRTSYDAFPVSFRLIVLDSQLEVKKALQCLLLNGRRPNNWRLVESNISLLGVVSAPLWNSEKSVFAGMFTVSDIIHLIQYYYHTSSYDNATTDVETFRLESLRGTSTRSPSATEKSMMHL